MAQTETPSSLRLGRERPALLRAIRAPHPASQRAKHVRTFLISMHAGYCRCMRCTSHGRARPRHDDGGVPLRVRHGAGSLRPGRGTAPSAERRETECTSPLSWLLAGSCILQALAAADGTAADRWPGERGRVVPRPRRPHAGRTHAGRVFGVSPRSPRVARSLRWPRDSLRPGGPIGVFPVRGRASERCSLPHARAYLTCRGQTEHARAPDRVEAGRGRDCRQQAAGGGKTNEWAAIVQSLACAPALLRAEAACHMMTATITSAASSLLACHRHRDAAALQTRSR